MRHFYNVIEVPEVHLDGNLVKITISDDESISLLDLYNQLQEQAEMIERLRLAVNELNAERLVEE